jgi:2-methylisocitrate lyase-like PEP mutase family enzyme
VGVKDVGVKDGFRELHDQGFLVMPNPWDVGSAVRLELMGFKALATTSSGHAASLGRQDQEVRFDELCEHVTALTAAVGVPVNVMQNGFLLRPRTSAPQIS